MFKHKSAINLFELFLYAIGEPRLGVKKDRLVEASDVNHKWIIFVCKIKNNFKGINMLFPC